MDFTAVSKSTIDGFKAIGAPLTEDQEMYLHGAIAGILINIDRLGLQQVVTNYEIQQRKRRPQAER